MRPTDAIEPVDYVLTGTSLTDTIDERFDWIVGSHVLEHTVCLVTFLRDIESLLRPGGSCRSRCPIAAIASTGSASGPVIGRVIDVFRSSQAVHSEGSVLEFYLDVVTKGDSISWDASHTGSFRQRHTLDEARAHAAIAAAGEYVDVHNWVFTPNHLRLLLVDLHTLGFIGLREVAFHETVGPEFYLALSPDGPGPGCHGPIWSDSPLSRSRPPRTSTSRQRSADTVRSATRRTMARDEPRAEPRPAGPLVDLIGGRPCRTRRRSRTASSTRSS